MTLRDDIENSIKTHLSIDVNDPDLDKLNDLSLKLGDFSASVSDVFEKPAAEFIKPLSDLILELNHAIHGKIFVPNEENFILFLNLISLIDPARLDEETPPELANFSLQRTDLKLYEKDGSPTNHFFYLHPTDLSKSVAFLYFEASSNIKETITDFSNELVTRVAILVANSSEVIGTGGWILSAISDKEKCMRYCMYHAILLGKCLAKQASFQSQTFFRIFLLY